MKNLTDSQKEELELLIKNHHIERVKRKIQRYRERNYDSTELDEYMEKCFNEVLVMNQGYISTEQFNI